MNRLVVTLLFVLTAISAPAQTDATIVVFDLSFSMSLLVDSSDSRRDVLVAELDRYLRNSGARDCALIVFEDRDSIKLALPFPATPDAVVSEIRSRNPWGRSPVLEATRAAVELAESFGRAHVVVVTDGEDDELYLLGTDSNAAVPPALSSESTTLSLITIAAQSPGSTPVLSEWAALSGGEVIALDRELSDPESAGPGDTADHEGERGREPGDDTAPGVSSRRLLRVVAAWLLVAQWNLVAAFLAGVVAISLSFRRSARRRRNAQTHNTKLLELVLEVRTTVHRFEETYVQFPVVVGTSSGSTLRLDKPADGSNLRFRLMPTDEGLEFSAKSKIKINGMGRTSWTLTEGDQVRFGKYRISVARFTRLKPLPMPPRISWQPAVATSAALTAAVAALLLYPVASARAGASGTPDLSAADGAIVQPADPVETPPSDGLRPDPSGTLPSVYARTSGIPFAEVDFMLVHAHPDDETLDTGILLSRLDAAGLSGVVVLLTDGRSGLDQYPDREVGGIYPAYDLDGQQLVTVRVSEARRALAWLGVDTYVRGELQNFPYNSTTDQLTPWQVLSRWGGAQSVARELAAVIEGFQPELLISPDGPAGAYEHFEHEATGIVTKMAREIAIRNGAPVAAHIMAVDPLQVGEYERLVAISPWDIHPETGRTFRWHQLNALIEHRTQRDASSVGIETRLAVNSEYYAVDLWNPSYELPAEAGIQLSPIELSEMARR